MAACPHGDPTCPCPDGAACHYEGVDAMVCPNPVLGVVGLTNPHCHVEGCDWLVTTCSRQVRGECGLVVTLGAVPPLGEVDGREYWSMTQAAPDQPGWACGWLRTPLNVANRAAS
jgi:hypothetical protein